jgi:hypothetical protein
VSRIGFGRKQSWPNLRYHPSTCLKGLGKPRKMSTRIAVSQLRLEPSIPWIQVRRNTVLANWFSHSVWGERDFHSRVFTKAAFERFAVQVSVPNVHTKWWWSRASHVTEGAFVVVHMMAHVVPQQSLRWVVLGAVWTLIPLHCNSSHQHMLDDDVQGKTCNLELSKHTSAVKHDLKFQLSLSNAYASRFITHIPREPDAYSGQRT